MVVYVLNGFNGQGFRSFGLLCMYIVHFCVCLYIRLGKGSGLSDCVMIKYLNIRILLSNLGLVFRNSSLVIYSMSLVCKYNIDWLFCTIGFSSQFFCSFSFTCLFVARMVRNSPVSSVRFSSIWCLAFLDSRFELYVAG